MNKKASDRILKGIAGAIFSSSYLKKVLALLDWRERTIQDCRAMLKLAEVCGE